MFCRKNTKHLIFHGHIIGYGKTLIFNFTNVIIYLYHMTFFFFLQQKPKGFKHQVKLMTSIDKATCGVSLQIGEIYVLSGRKFQLFNCHTDFNLKNLICLFKLELLNVLLATLSWWTSLSRGIIRLLINCKLFSQNIFWLKCLTLLLWICTSESTERHLATCFTVKHIL